MGVASGFGRIAVVACLCGPTTSGLASDKERAKTVALVTCPDTSGSMEELIESARISLRTIVDEFARADARSRSVSGRERLPHPAKRFVSLC